VKVFKRFIGAIFLMSFSFFSVADEVKSEPWKVDYMDSLVYASDYYWAVHNYFGYMEVVSELESIEPRFAPAFNTALALSNVGDYEEASNKLANIEDSYHLSAQQIEQISQFRKALKGIAAANDNRSLARDSGMNCFSRLYGCAGSALQGGGSYQHWDMVGYGGMPETDLGHSYLVVAKVSQYDIVP
jgi:hypothetical protein